MKSMLVLPARAVLFTGAALLAVGSSACQSGPNRGPDQTAPPPHRGADASAGSSGTGGMASASSAGEKAGIGSWFGMCELSRQIKNARTPAERQALIDQVMPDMPQDSRDRHLRMMRQNCQ